MANVAVAWGCALLPIRWLAYPGSEWSSTAGDWFVFTSERAGVHGVVVHGPWAEARTEDGSHVGERLPKWVSRALFDSKELVLLVDSRGWPFPTMYGVRLPAAVWGPDASYALPFRPIWTAFAINTLFYAATLWLLIRGPFGVRRFLRFLRLERGLCPKCAYPMGESYVCTECGRALPSSA